jgi:hypothetical protein
MPFPAIPFADIRKVQAAFMEALREGWPAEAVTSRSAVWYVGHALGLSGKQARDRLRTAQALGLEVPGREPPDPAWSEAQRRRYRAEDPDYAAWAGATTPAQAVSASRARPAARTLPAAAPAPLPPPLPAAPQAPVPAAVTPDRIIGALRRAPATLEALTEKLGANPFEVGKLLAEMLVKARSIQMRGEVVHLVDAPAMGSQLSREEFPEIVSDAHGRYKIGAVGDTHLGSKYERLDCLTHFYGWAAEQGVRLFLHAGNYVDGDASFNVHDLHTHGLDPQLQYLAQHYPRIEGCETWAVTGADHEGWWAKREAVDVGRYTQNVMCEAGRTDWRDVGYMESYIKLRDARSGKTGMLHLMHPGGGSAYAISYQPQKIVEAYDGGDKPSVLLIGHYHKASYQLTRNVHAFQVGCFQDQTPFMRQKKLSAHVGGWVIELEQDEATGAIIAARGEYRNYFVRDYYSGRWSHHGPARSAPRSVA